VSATGSVLQRLFAFAGTPLPTGALGRTFARAPRDRLVRAVAWYAYAWELEGLPEAQCLSGVRLVLRGWDDVYMTSTLPTGAELVEIESPGRGRALVTRHGRHGRGWQKARLSAVGEVRPEIDLGARWLGSLAGCIVHDDCAENPELGAACALLV
jgi:hypothetical protein